MTNPTLTPRAWAELLLLGLIWGASFFSIATALEEIGPLTSVLYRTGIAALAIWPVLIWRGIAPPRGLATWGALAIMGLLNNVVPFSLMAWGQLFVPTGLTSILNATTAIFGVLIAAVVFADERLSLRKSVGVLIGFGGVATAIGPSAILDLDLTSLGQLAILLGTVSYACAGAWARKTLAHLHPVAAAVGMLTSSTVLMVPLSLSIEGWPTVDHGAQTWLAVLYYALVATAFAYLLYYRVLAMAGAGNLLLVTLVIPPVAIVLGAQFRGEVLAPTAYAGLALLALGLLIIDGRLLRWIGKD